MAVEIALNTPLADALHKVVQTELIKMGWVNEGSDDTTLTEYIVLMLVNGRTQEDVASEIGGDLLSLGPNDPDVQNFTSWLFAQVVNLSDVGSTVPVGPGAEAQDPSSTDQDTDMDMSNGAAETSIPTAPKSMRHGPAAQRGVARDKRLLGQIYRAMDRSQDSILHRVRGATGTERINAHARGPPTGPRTGSFAGRAYNRIPNNRANTVAPGLPMSGLPGLPGAMNPLNDMNWMVHGGGSPGSDIYTLLQQQNQMMAALQQQLTQASQNQNQNGHSNQGRGRGRSLYERTDRVGRLRRGGGHYNNGKPFQSGSNAEDKHDGEDVDMDQDKPVLSPEFTPCNYNLNCTNKDCKFAHQSPAAPPNTPIDVNDTCSFGVACKNHKCVGRHPSPATKRAHQIEQICKFFPNCANPRCAFKHPDAPVCRNGGDCKVEGCKFTHVATMCKFKPCTNRFCAFKHEEGQRGLYGDKVWTADGAKNHVSERRYIIEDVDAEELGPSSNGAESVARDAVSEMESAL